MSTLETHKLLLYSLIHFTSYSLVFILHILKHLQCAHRNLSLSVIQTKVSTLYLPLHYCS
jgi:hypothetical protein